MICYSNENNVQGMSVTDCAMVSTPSQHDVVSNTLDNIRGCSSVMRMCAVHLSMCHRTISQATNSQVSTHYIAMSEVDSWLVYRHKHSDSFPSISDTLPHSIMIKVLMI